MNSNVRIYTQKELSELNDFNKIQEHAFCDEISDIFSMVNLQALLRSIKDPEYPFTLEELGVIKLSDIKIIKENQYKLLQIFWTPTFPKCGFASQIGLAIRWKLDLELFDIHHYKIQLFVKPEHHDDSHTSLFFQIVNKQLNDKERIKAAHENESLKKFIEALL